MMNKSLPQDAIDTHAESRGVIYSIDSLEEKPISLASQLAAQRHAVATTELAIASPLTLNLYLQHFTSPDGH